MASVVRVSGRLETNHQPPKQFPPTVAQRVEQTDGRTKLYENETLIATVQTNGDILFDASSFSELEEQRNDIEDMFVTHSVLPPNAETSLFVTTATIRFEEPPSKEAFTCHPLLLYEGREEGPVVSLVNEPTFYVELLGVSTMGTASTTIDYSVDDFKRTLSRFLSAYKDAH